LRIVSGSLKGRILHPPKNFKARPTTDIAKEGLFNVLAHKYTIEECSVLDLFAGTGNISYEFASRGAKKVVAIERNFHHFKYIQETITSLNLESIVSCKKVDVFSWLKRDADSYDIIFADPPYDLSTLAQLPESILSTNLLSPEGLLIVEHPIEYNFSEIKGFIEQRKYGKVNFSLFEHYESGEKKVIK